jgi:hypothetical protein
MCVFSVKSQSVCEVIFLLHFQQKKNLGCIMMGKNKKVSGIRKLFTPMYVLLSFYKLMRQY